MQPIVRRGLFGLVLLAGLAWMGASVDRTGSTTAGRIPAPEKGFLAPDFTLADPKGASYTLSAMRGKPVLINVWATWCPPCRAEMPTIEEYYKLYHGQGLTVLAVNVTDQDYPLNIVPFTEQYGLTFPILLDETGAATRKYEVRAMPSSYFVNRDGSIAEVVVGGPMSGVLLRTYIEEILKSRAN